ncbi:serine dehydratase subunit alpha family protein [Lactococcus garvieae]|nr:serine dehydratase subunit alpha family protein [Lactococcus garvieae]
MLTEEIKTSFLEVLEEGVKPATGCTEPVAVAYAAAICSKYLGSSKIASINIRVSANVMKNALAVIVPGTGEAGVKVAAAAGAIGGDAEAGLKVISNLKENVLREILELAKSDHISAEVVPVEDKLYVEVTIMSREDTVTVKIAGGHTHVYWIQKNEEVIFEKEKPLSDEESKHTNFLKSCRFTEIWEFATCQDLESICSLKRAKDLNMALVKEGLEHDYGMKIGKTLLGERQLQLLSLEEKIVVCTAAASDARMGGAQRPAMTNSGSGNQGITATVPVCVFAQHREISDEKLIRALTLSHLTALYIHAFLPLLSAYCATDSAAMGAAAALIYLESEDEIKAEMAIKNMIGDAVGMICDGAGFSCAIKVVSSVSSMYRAVRLAQAGIVIPATNGIVSENVDDCIRDLGRYVSEGMQTSDPVILDIMMNKN